MSSRPKLLLDPPKTFDLNKCVLYLGLINGYYDGERIVCSRNWRMYQNFMNMLQIYGIVRYTLSFLFPKESIVQFYLADMFNFLPVTGRLFLIGTGIIFTLWPSFITREFHQLNRKPETTFWMRFLPATQPLTSYKYVGYPRPMRRQFLQFSSVWLRRLNVITYLASATIVNMIYFRYYTIPIQPKSRLVFFAVYITQILLVNVYAVQMVIILIIMSICLSLLCEMFSKRYKFIHAMFDRLAIKAEDRFRLHKFIRNKFTESTLTKQHQTLTEPSPNQSKSEFAIQQVHKEAIKLCCVDLIKLIIIYNSVSVEMLRINRFWSRIVFWNNVFGLILIVIGLFSGFYSENPLLVLAATCLLLMFYLFIFIF
jgi:hypothetical protein